MANPTQKPDELSFKLKARFLQNGVVHRSNKKDWWDILRLRGKKRWRKVQDLGGGTFGVVWLEKETVTQQLRAVKRMALLDLQSKKIDFRRELQTMIVLQNHQDSFVKFLGWYDDKNFIYLAMEYIEYGDLAQYLKSFGKQENKNAVDITKQLLEGLVVLHDRHICHRDLKPQNVLIASITPIHVKLADFGLSKCAIGTKLDTRCGTSGYQAPELLGLLPQGNRHLNEYTNAVDMWALGCLVHEILTTEVPFLQKLPNPSSEISGLEESPSSEGFALLDMNLLYGYCSSINPFPAKTLQFQVNSSGLDFVKRLLVPDPESRMCAEASLRYEWIVGYNLESLLGEFESLGVILTRKKAAKLIEGFMESGHVDLSLFFSRPVPLSIPDLLVTAAYKGYTLIFQILLQIRRDRTGKVKPRLDLEEKALQVAARGGHLEIVKFLLGKGANVNSQPTSYRGRTTLQAAASGGHLEVVAFLLEKGANVNSLPAPRGGRTALQAAAGSGHLEVVTLLLEKGADINSEPGHIDGRTALQAAAGGGYLEVVRLLLEKGADMNSKPTIYKGRTALQAAAGGGHLEVVRLLLDEGADMNSKPTSYKGRTALQAAAGGGHLEVVRLLLNEGADINSEPAHDWGQTALQAAAGSGHLEVVKLLLEKGADINSEPAPHGGQTALQAAAGSGHLEVVRLLFDQGADMNSKPTSYTGRTALQAAAGGGHFEVVRLLLDEGADINSKPASYKGRTALQAAAGSGHLEVVRLLLNEGADINSAPAHDWGRTALQAAAGGGYLEVVILLLEKGADVNSLPGFIDGRTALQAAAGGGHLRMVEFLLSRGSHINIDILGPLGRTALQAAAEGGHLEVTAFLLGNGADVNARVAMCGLTALQEAIVGENIEIVRLLLDSGADPNCNSQSSIEKDPKVVAERGNPKISTLLSKRQGNPDSNSKLTMKPLEIATTIGHNKIRELLLSAGAT